MNNVKKSIGWCDYTINPVKGKCPMGCSYCYARRLYDRFKWNPEIRLDVASIYSVDDTKTPSRIFVGSTMELFGEHIQPEWYDYIWGMVKNRPQHTFIFLTKCPQNLIKWSPFHENCWVGVTGTDYRRVTDACGWLDNVEAKVKFISIEPLLSWSEDINTSAIANWISDINWLIIGQQTPVSKKTEPKIEWVQEIALATTKANISLFIKDNLRPLLPHRMPFYDAVFYWSEDRTHQLCEYRLRQEFPKF